MFELERSYDLGKYETCLEIAKSVMVPCEKSIFYKCLSHYQLKEFEQIEAMASEDGEKYPFLKFMVDTLKDADNPEHNIEFMIEIDSIRHRLRSADGGSRSGSQKNSVITPERPELKTILLSGKKKANITPVTPEFKTKVK